MTSIGFDADQDCSGVAAAAVDAGASFVCRYLKNLTLAEAQKLSTAGLKIVSIFESTAKRALGGAANGTEDGARALEQAGLLGQPQGSAIYATADFDTTSAQQSSVLAYFRAFKVALEGQGKLGVYANGATCQTAFDAGIADYTWLAGGMGMRGSREFAESGKATLVQDVGDKKNLDLTGIRDDIDSDTAYAEDYGGWSLAA